MELRKRLERSGFRASTARTSLSMVLGGTVVFARRGSKGRGMELVELECACEINDEVELAGWVYDRANFGGV